MKALSFLSACAFLAAATIPNAFASSAYTCTTFSQDTVVGIDNKGEVLAFTESAAPPHAPHAFLRNPDGSISPLLAPSGNDSFYPEGINNLGQVLGQTENEAGAFILNSDGSYTDVAAPVAPAGHTYGRPYFSGINDKGELDGVVTEDFNGDSGFDLDFIRSADGKYKVVDQSGRGYSPSLLPGTINNSGAMLDHMRDNDGSLLLSNGSKIPLTFPGLTVYSGMGSNGTVTKGLNNNNVMAGYLNDALNPFAFLHTPDGHYPALVCPDAAFYAPLNVIGINDQNVVVGTVDRRLPSGSGLETVNFIATPTGASPQVQLSNSTWTFSSHFTGQTSGLGRVLVSNTGAADLHIEDVYAASSGQASDRVDSFGPVPSNCLVGEGFQPNTIPPGGSCFVEFTFTPRVTGWQTAAIYIADDAPDGPQSIQVGGTGMPLTLQLSNTSWTFGTHPIGETSGKGVIYAYNPGPGTVTFQNTNIYDGNYGNPFRLTGNTCGAELQPYRTCALTFYFTPAIQGANPATLYLGDNTTNGPIRIPLSGTATVH